MNQQVDHVVIQRSVSEQETVQPIGQHQNGAANSQPTPGMIGILGGERKGQVVKDKPSVESGKVKD
jgi:phage gp45-like